MGGAASTFSIRSTKVAIGVCGNNVEVIYETTIDRMSIDVAYLVAHNRDT